ncbi:MAG: Rid family detoxifying hydrolase [Limnochordia bacterium]|jgi:2-iminobutanoate/2-iminopropanoate deaminase|nr:Rid family detoxifying hydrolase [Limnochordia bacterium]
MKKEIKTEQAPKAIGPYSQAVQCGNLLFISGQIPLDSQGRLVGEKIEEQTRQALSNVSSILTAAGGTVENLIEVTVFLTDLSYFGQFNEIYGEWLGQGVMPARAVVEVSRLPKGVLIEIAAKAYVDI